MAAARRWNLTCDLDRRFFQALCTGVFRRDVLLDPETTTDLIVESVFAASALGPDERERVLADVSAVLAEAARANWTPEEAAEALRTRAVGQTEHLDVLAAFWAASRDKAFLAMADRSAWNPTVTHVAWRADIISGRRKREGESEDAASSDPVVLVEIDTGSRPGVVPLPGATASPPIRFEATREQLASLVRQLDAVESALGRLGGSGAATAASPVPAGGAGGAASPVAGRA